MFEALLTAYADIGDALPRFDRYQKAFDEDLGFQSVLAAVYSNILEFHQRAYKFFRRRGRLICPMDNSCTETSVSMASNVSIFVEGF